MKILFKYTTRSRRSNFLRGIESIISNLSNDKEYHILISVENEFNDPEMYPLPKLNCNHTYCVNQNKPTTKVDAINRDVNECAYDWDVLINMSDDMVFTKKGFDDIIRNSFYPSFYVSESKTFNSSGIISYCDYLIHFPDGNRNDLVTMSIMGRDYYKRFNYIYHPDYKSLWCDNEATDVAKLLDCYKFVDREIFNHLHPAYNKGNFDKQYQITESFSGEDYETYKKRKQNGFA